MNAEYYSNYIQRLRSHELLHRNFEQARQALYTHASLASAGTVLVLVGPTRGGKTTIAQYIRQALVKPTDVGDTEMPLVTVDAANAQDGLFSMKHLTLRCLDAIKHPIFKGVGAAADSEKYFPRVNFSETYLRIALEKGLLARKTRYLVIDEASHLVIGRKARRASEVLDSLKSLCNTTNIVLILIGGYSLLPNLFTSAHLSGRMRVIALRDYKDSKADRAEFDRILVTLDEFLPLRKGDSLLDFNDALFSGSLGLYGLLINWLEAAICAMAVDETSYIKKAHLQRIRLEEQINAIREEIDQGDALLDEHRVEHVPFYLPDTHSEKGKKKPRRPFVRKPVRDPVGEQEESPQP